MSNLWQDCVLKLQTEIPVEQFNTWIRPLHALESGTELKLLAPNKFVLDWVQENYLDKIEGFLAQLDYECITTLLPTPYSILTG